MAKFSLTAQIGLQAPTNTKQVVSQIQNALKGVSVNVNVNANARQLAQVSNQLNSVNQSAKAANTSVSELGKTIGAAARRFGAISLVTGTFLGLSRSIKNSLGDAIEFERQMVILAQVTEKSVKQLNDLYSEVTRLATGFGVSSESLLKTSIILAQAGLEARKTKGALEVLAKTQLAASFDDITSTTEGAIAILAQFRREAAAAGGEIVFLERSLEAINQVSKKYAVESSDLVAVIRRSGGAFEAAGGSLNELLALFTSVRATTRESAETISTGLRTIFTRIQRVDTIRQLKDLGIELQDLEGKFVGPFEAIKRISEGLSSLDPRDFRFAQIVEELGGFRQISKVIPLIKQFGLAQEALNTAQSASGSLTQDAATAQQSLANQLTKVNEEFQALIRKFTDSEAFHSVAGGALEFARALIRIADAIEPLLPMIASLAAFNVGRGFVSALGAFTGFGGQRRNNGGKIHAFATGGMVPGSGNTDTVPAMLTPGEFVIRKASVKKFGAQNLAKLNGGGVAEAPQPSFGGVGIFDSDMITGGTNVKKDLLSKIKASQKPYEVIAGPAGSGKSTLATTKFGKNFVFSDADIEKYSKFVVLSGASKTKSGDFSDDVQNLLTSASKISVLAPDEERLTKQRQIRFESSLAGNLLDQRSSDALRGTLKAPMGANEDLFKKYKNVEILRQYSSGTGARGVEPRRLATEARGVVQRLNDGGELKTKDHVGALFLEPASKIQDTETVSVSKKDVLAAEPSFDSRRYFHGFDETKKDEKTYTIHKSGLKDDKSSNYSEIFNNILNEGIKNAVNTVVTQVAGSLNIDKPEVTRDANTYAKYINKGARGILFEEAIAQLSRQGGGDPYDNRADTQAPFDFVGSIGNAAGLFKNGLATTAKYKDAKASYSAKVIESIQNKIARQISRESLSSFIYEKNNRFDQELIKGDDDKGDGSWSKKKLIDYLRKNDPNIIGMQAPPDTVRNRLEILGFKENQDYEVTGGKTGGYSYRFKSREQEPELVKKAIGGGVGGTDTVPALLTPGEFVINRKSAQRIGYGKLHRLNKTGSVHGYANGGVVGMNDGGFVGMKTGGDQKSAKERYKAQQSAKRRQERMVKEGIAGQDEQFVQTYFESQHAQGSLRRIPKVRGAGGKSEEMMGRTPGTITAGTGRALGTNKLSLDAIRGLGEIANKLSLTYEQGVVLEKKYLQLRRKGLGHEEALQKATERATKLTLERNKNFDKKEEPGKKPDKQGRAIDIEAFQKLASSAQQFIFLGSSVAAVATQFSALDAATSRAITETIAFGSTMVGLAGTVSDLFISLGKAVVGTAAETTAKGAETMASWGVTASLLPFATIAIAVVAALALLAGGLYFMKARAKAVSEEYSKQAKQIADDIESGKRSTAEKESFVQKERAAAESLADSYWFLWGAKKREADAAEAAARSYINIIAAIADFDKAISAIDADKSLTPAQKAGKKLEAFGKASSEASDDILSAAKQRSAIAASVGKDIASVTKSDLASEGQFKEFERLGEAVDKGSELLKSSFTRISAELQVGLEDAMSKTDFSKAATDINLDGVVDSFDAVLEQNSAFAQSLNDQTNRIRTNAETLAQLQREAGNFVGALATTKEAESQIANLNKSYQAQAMATAKAQAGAIALAKTMRDTAKTGFIASKMSDYFVGVMDGLTKFEKDLNLISSVMNNEFANFELPEIKGLDDISKIQNLDKFKTQVTQVGSVLGETGKDIAGQVIAVADVFKRSNDILNKNFNTIGQGETASAGNDARDAIDAVLEPLKGFPALGPLISNAKSALLKAATGGEEGSTITASEREKALGPLKEFTDRYADLLKQINETQIAQLKQYSSYVTQLAAAQQKEVAFREGFVNIQERGAQRFAEATGNPLTTQQKEGFRTAKVSARLGGVGLNPTIAGNAQALGATLQSLNAELLKTQGADADSIAKNRKLTLQAQETTKALEGMADQSDKAADVLSDIAKERAKREVASKMLESFVVGGPEERMQMMQTSAGLQAAQQAGTLQILPPEIRKSVTSMLDELSFGDPTSEAAKLKKNLVLNDAVRMGLVSQGQAQQIAEATPLEQKLQQDLINITNEENLALEALRQANLSNKDALQQNTDALYANIANEKTLAQQKVEEAKKQFDAEQETKARNAKANVFKDKADAINLEIEQIERNAKINSEELEKSKKQINKESALASNFKNADDEVKKLEAEQKLIEEKAAPYKNAYTTAVAGVGGMFGPLGMLATGNQFTGATTDLPTPYDNERTINNKKLAEAKAKREMAKVEFDDVNKKRKILEDMEQAQRETRIPYLKDKAAGFIKEAENKSQAANFATGGTVSGKGGRDSIPAMLTDGEFVINKQSAQKIGYDNLNRLNNTGSILGYFNGGAESARQKTQAQQAKINDFATRRYNINEGIDPFVEDKEKAIQAIDREEKLFKRKTIRDQSPSAQRKQAIEAQRQQLRQRFESQRNLPAEDRQKLIQQNAIRIERERLMRQGYNVPPILTNFANPQQNPFVPQNATAPTTRNAQGPYVPPQAAPMAAQSAAVASRPTPGTNPVITLDQGAQDILKNIPAAFNGFADRMQKITNTLNGLTVNHTLNVKGSLNINSTEVANAVTKALGEYIGNEINRILKNKDNGNPEPPTR